MYIPERIKYFRLLRGLTQKSLGLLAGFGWEEADVRIAQYEKGRRHPKQDTLNRLANALDVSPYAIDIPDITTNEGIMHTLFLLEDLYGLEVRKIRGEVVLYPTSSTSRIAKLMNEWYKHTHELHNRRNSKRDYDNWRYNYE